MIYLILLLYTLKMIKFIISLAIIFIYLNLNAFADNIDIESQLIKRKEKNITFFDIPEINLKI